MPFDPNTPTVIQSGNWQCSAASSAWVLRSMGIPWGQDDVVAWLGPRHIKQADGLQDGSGRMLAALFRERGLDASFGQITWERALQMAGRQPFCMGGGRWNHWTAVRGTDGRRLLLANPAPNWQGVGQDIDHEEWIAWGGWNAVWVNVTQSLDDLEAASPGIAQAILEWQRARYKNREDGNDFAACRAHLVAIGVADPGQTEPSGFRRPTVEELEAGNAGLRQLVAEWQQARRQNREDPHDYVACRSHLRALGSPDPGPAEFLGFVG
jgi:hypothetical protein